MFLLLCCLSGEGSSTVSPLTPGDLLISLHNIDSNKCDMKSIIKGQCELIKPYCNVFVMLLIFNGPVTPTTTKTAQIINYWISLGFWTVGLASSLASGNAD